jgi:RNA recognition motif-containing protein
MDSDDLEEMFGSVGDVTSAIVEIKSVRNRDYRVGYVEMGTDQEAFDGIERFHGQKMGGQVLVVTEDIPHVPGSSLLEKKKFNFSSNTKKRFT